MADETASETTPATTPGTTPATNNKHPHPLLHRLKLLWELVLSQLPRPLQRRIKLIEEHLLDEILIAWLNIVFNVGWEETYDYLFGNYGMLPIPYFPIP
ncbi:unnamed protein product [Lasius platythorax]